MKNMICMFATLEVNMIVETYAYAAGSVFIYMVLWFLAAVKKSDNSMVDVAWGLGFILVAIVSFLLNPFVTPRKLLILALVVLWGVRLSLHIYIRNRGKGEDYRYANWRREWGTSYLVKSFFIVFMLQGFLLLVIAYAIVLVFSFANGSLGVFDIVGVGVWLAGVLFEAIGDFQLVVFKKNALHKGKIMRSGLWKFTRHPNYFGETVLWWGMLLVSLSVPLGWTALISPLLITFLLLRVSGVPLLEQKYSENPAYQDYQRSTNAFLPWFPKT